MTDFSASFVARSLPALLDGAHVRASNGTDTGLDGTLSTVSSNVPAFDRDRGVVLEAGATNSNPWSHNLTVDGTVRGTATATFVASGGPRAGKGYTALTGLNTGNNDIYDLIAGGTSGQPIAASFYMRRVSTSGVVDFLNPQALANGRWSVDLSLVPEGWQRITASHPAVTVVNAFSVHTANIHGWQFRAVSGGPLAVDVAEVQLEVNATFPTSPILTEGSAVLRQPSYISSTLSALGVASQTNEYSFAVAVKMPFSSAVAASSTAVFATLFQGANNKLQIEHTTTAGRIGFTAVVNSNTETAHVSGLTWAVGDVLVFALSKGATNGLIAIADGTVATNTAANGKAVFGAALASMALCADHADSSHGTGTIVGFRIWDTALSQAELEALDASMFDPVVTLDGITYPATVTGSNQVSITVAGIGEFDAAGDHAATPWYENVPVTLAIGDESASSTLQVVAPVPENFGTAGASPVYPPVGLSIGDDVYVDKVSGAGTADPEGVNYIAATASVVRFRAFDQNAGLWLAYREESFAAASTGVVRSPLRGVVRSIIYSVVE